MTRGTGPFLAAHGAAPHLRINNFPIRVGRGHALPKSFQESIPTLTGGVITPWRKPGDFGEVA